MNTSTMKAIGYYQSGPIDRADAFVAVELPRPTPTGHDILVKVAAVSVNPVDVKVRGSAARSAGDDLKVLGFDAAGTVEAVGPDATLFEVGDKVWYAGSIARSGSNAEYQLVDERIVGHAPKSLASAEAAALPLTAITAWEMLFDRLDVRKPVAGAENAILIIGGAGGVGSIAIQLARTVPGLTVIATASRAETRQWALDLGAHHVVDHSRPLAAELAGLGIGAPGFVFSTNASDRHFDQIVELMAPQGRFGLIDDPDMVDVRKFKRKSLSLHWELMFTRAIFGTDDMVKQHSLLNEVARLVDAGTIRTTVSDHYGAITVDNLKRAHAHIETGKARGKIVLEGF